MHALFMFYGIKDASDLMIRDMQCQKFPLKFTSPDGKETRIIWMQGNLRTLPMGIIDYIFPKESMAYVLTALRFQPSTNPTTKGKRHNYEYISPFKVNILRKMFKAEKIPDFPTDQSCLWMTENVSIIPIGIRYDGEITEPANSGMPGWTHEAI